jgi:hypothetical protein
VTSLRPTLYARPATRLVLVPAVVGAMLALVGCSATNAITTQKAYSPADGVRVVLSDSLTAENLVVLTAAKGARGTLLGAITNRGTSSEQVTITAEGADAVTVRVPAGTTTLLTPQTDKPSTEGVQRQAVDVKAVSVAPGAVLALTIAAGSSGNQAVSVPVLDGSMPEYTALVPTAG